MNWNSPKTLWVLALLLMAGLTLVYWNHFDSPFHFDDTHTIVNNEYIRDIQNVPLFFTDPRTGSALPTNQGYRPVIATLNAIDYWIAGELDTRAFHWHIFIEFLVLLIVLFVVLLKLFRRSTGRDHYYTALVTTALFSYHVTTAETINYIIARSDGFSTLMVLLGLLIHISAKGWKKQLGLIPLIIGALAKPTTLMLAPLILLYELMIEPPSLTVREEHIRWGAKLKEAIKSTSLYFLVGAGMYLFTRSMYPDTWTPGGDYSSLEYLNTQAWVIWVYVKTFFVPTGLTADTDMDIIRQLLAPKVLWGLALIATMLVLSWLASRQRRTLPIAFGILWFFVALAPSSSIIPLAEVMNHHRTFFPYIGLSMAMCWAGYLVFAGWAGDRPGNQARLILATGVGLLLASHAWGTMQRVEVWSSSKSLWRDVTQKSPNNGRGLMNYGLALMREGDMEEAIRYYQLARATNYGQHPYLFINLGIATDSLARQTQSSQLLDDAESYFIKAISLGAKYPQTHYRYSRWLHTQGRDEEALPYVIHAIRLSPANRQALELRDQIIQSEQIGLEQAQEAAESAQTPEAFLNLSLKYYNVGDYAASISAAETALKLRPNYALAFNNICSAHNMLKQFEKAIAACEQALAISPDFERAKGNLNWARQQLDQP